MNYAIHLTAAAEKDLENAADHIEIILKNPKAADDLLSEAESKLGSLAAFPAMHALVDDPLLSFWGIRFVQVKNYLAFYVISEEKRQITVVRFLYRKSNWLSILKQGFSIT